MYSLYQNKHLCLKTDVGFIWRSYFRILNFSVDLLSEGSEKRAGGLNLVHLDAEVFGKKRLCRLCGKYGENLVN